MSAKQPDAKLERRRWSWAVGLSFVSHILLLLVGNWAFDSDADGRDEGTGEINELEIVAISPEEVSALLSRKGAPQAPRLLEAPDPAPRTVMQGPAPLDLVRPIQDLRQAPTTPQAVMLDVPAVLLEPDSSGLLTYAAVEVLDAPWQSDLSGGGGSGEGSGILPSPDRAGLGDLEVGSEGAGGDAAPLLDGRNINLYTLYRELPRYTRSMRERGLTGKVTVLIDLDALGRVTDVDILQSSGHEELDESAEQAFRRWRFDPKSLAKMEPPYQFRYLARFGTTE